MRKLMTEETKAVFGGVYDVKKYGFYDGWCVGAKCGFCGCEWISPFGWNGLIGERYARDKAYACELDCAEYYLKYDWEPAGTLGR